MLPGLTNPALKSETEITPFFARFARWVERQVGRSSTFVLAIAAFSYGRFAVLSSGGRMRGSWSSTPGPPS
jgi:hypothetical protein